MNIGNLNLQQLAQQIPAILAAITALIGGIGGVAPQLSSVVGSSESAPAVPGQSTGQPINGVVRVTDVSYNRAGMNKASATINGVQYPDSLVLSNGYSAGRSYNINISQYDGFSGRFGFIDGSESNQYATAQVLIDDAVVWEQRVNHGEVASFNLEVTNNRKAEMRVTTFQASSDQKWEYGGFAFANPQMYKD